VTAKKTGSDTVLLTFGGKYAHREAETYDAEEFIGKKGIAAKGKKCHTYTLKKVEFGEPIHKPEDDIVPEPEEQENLADEPIDVEDILDVPVEPIDLPDPGDINAGEAGEEPTLF